MASEVVHEAPPFPSVSCVVNIETPGGVGVIVTVDNRSAELQSPATVMYCDPAASPTVYGMSAEAKEVVTVQPASPTENSVVVS